MVASLTRREPARAAADELEGRSRALPWAVGWTIVFATVFIRRSTTEVDGQRTFTLFDDAMVSMRYAHNLARGNGLVWNAGQPGVEGYTNFLWTLWMSLLHLTGTPIRLVGLLVSVSGVALLVANLVVVAAICRRLAPAQPIVLRTALLLTATCYPLLFWTLRGMEVGLVALVLSTATLYAIRFTQGEPRAALGLAAAGVVGVLTRTDVVVPLAVILGYAAVAAPRPQRRLALLAGGAPVAALAVHTALRVRWYGGALPNTYALKLEGIPLADRLERGGAVALAQLAVEVMVPFVLAVAATVVTRGTLRREAALLATVVLSCLAYEIYVGGDAWEWMRIANRYLVPTLPLLFVLCGIGVAHWATEVLAGRGRVLWVASGGLLVGALVAHSAPFPRTLLQNDDKSMALFTTPLVLAAVVVAIGALAVRWRASHPGSGVTPRVIGSTLAIALVLGSSGGAFGRWLENAGDHVSSDALTPHLAAAVEASTAPDATIAVAWAGSVPYFADRQVIDLLGKSDPVIAHSAPHDMPLYPGHMRWDYSYSVGRLRPDVIVTVWVMEAGDEADFASWGYRQLDPEYPVWARTDSAKVDVAALMERLDRI